MGEGLVPVEYWEMEPKYKNLFENGAAVQFNHRLLATSTLTSTLLLWGCSRRYALAPPIRTAFSHVAAMVCIQASLGIATLLYYVPTPVAATHQAGSLVLMSLYMRLMYLIKYVK
eukprot:TRINITY_DN5752_c0_g1_i3.p1 TRINITY_DN5752_c0_g1~~TRINITY_DN5752_c0_g1_i3.p1  ORF type:complete len:115 (-),score=23.13 TRINITY_DN5752_c0_g1_i3:37-381(-)